MICISWVYFHLWIIEVWSFGGYGKGLYRYHMRWMVWERGTGCWTWLSTCWNCKQININDFTKLPQRCLGTWNELRCLGHNYKLYTLNSDPSGVQWWTNWPPNFIFLLSDKYFSLQRGFGHNRDQRPSQLELANKCTCCVLAWWEGSTHWLSSEQGRT